MADPARVRVDGPLEPYARGFAGELARRGYMPSSSCSQLRLMAHVSRWLASEGLDAAALTPATVARFVAARRAGYANSRSSRGLGPLLGYLRDLGVTPTPASAVVEATTASDELLARYRRYLTVERGLALGTAGLYVGKVRPFLVARSGGEGLDVGRLRAGDVSVFVLAECRGRSTASAKHLVTALRSFLRFLHLEACSKNRWRRRSRRSLAGGWRGSRGRLSRTRYSACSPAAIGARRSVGGTSRSCSCWRGSGCAAARSRA